MENTIISNRETFKINQNNLFELIKSETVNDISDNIKYVIEYVDSNHTIDNPFDKSRLIKLIKGKKYPFQEVIEIISAEEKNISWIDLSVLYSKKDETVVRITIIKMFYYIFNSIKEELNVYNEYWGDFCLDVWNIQSDVYDYNKNSLSKETQAYLNMLEKSGIEKDYTGSCKCNNWDHFLPIILKCVVNHIALYSPLLYSVTGNFFFYFHYFGEIGLYYKECNKTIEEIINKWNNYLLSDDQYIYN